MPHIDMSTYLADDTLDLDNIPSTKYPKGRTYKIPSLSGEDGLLLQVINSAPDALPAGSAADETDEDEAKRRDEAEARTVEAIEAMDKFCRDAEGKPTSLERKLFGAAYDEMIADGVSNNNMKKTMSAVMVQASMGTEAAQMLVQRAVQRAAGEAVARANRATRRAAPKKAAAKKSASSPVKAGSKSARTSGAKSTPRARANTRGRSASTSQAQAV